MHREDQRGIGPLLARWNCCFPDAGEKLPLDERETERLAENATGVIEF